MSRSPAGTTASGGRKPRSLQPTGRSGDSDDAQGRLIATARRAIGLGGGAPDRPEADRFTLRTSGPGWYLACMLGCFAAGDQVLGLALARYGSQIRAALGVSASAYSLALSQRYTAIFLVAVELAIILHRTQRRGRPVSRRTLTIIAATRTGVAALLIAFCSSFWPLFLSIALSGTIAGAVWALHRPMLMDAYPVGVRVRAMAVHQAGIVAGVAAAPLLLWLLSGPFGLGWRGVFLGVGLAMLAMVLLAHRIKEPPLGRYDAEPARMLVPGADPAASSNDLEELGFVEMLRRLWLVPTIQRLLTAWAVLGASLAPLVVFMMVLFEDRWHASVADRYAYVSLAWAFSLPALAWFAPRADRLFGQAPDQLVAACAKLMVVSASGLILGVATPWLPVAVIGFGIGLGASTALLPALVVLTFSVVEPRARPAAGVLIALFMFIIGGLLGSFLLGGLDRRFGAAVAIGLLAVPTCLAAALLRRAASTINGDIDRLLGQVIESEEVAVVVRSGGSMPLLACRHIDFSYGQLQVLFDVNFSVDEGEIVALLGTNGAGKSTLLRVICGLGLPSRGSVRLAGRDITHIDTERRVTRGISQVPGGRAVFGPMSVLDNLRVLGYTHGRDRPSIEAGIEASFAAFPRLAERRTQAAATLSGGEQQMLGLATAFITRPRLLLIDELSLGLAPKIVGELLGVLRQISAQGTAIVLVEQSVNVALSIVEHAYFMEKGQIRFDGPSEKLLSKPELLRSVFLEGASQGLKAHV